jgi:type VI secretion system protein ImpJ
MMDANAGTSGLTRIAIAEILETTENGEVILDQSFIPSVLNVQASPFLVDKNKMLHSLIWNRAEQVMARIRAGQGDKSEQSLMKEHRWLQTLSRWLPWADQLMQVEAYPTPRLYTELSTLAAELSSLIPALPSSTPPFYFDQLHSLFNPLYLKLKQLLGTVVQDSVVTFEWDRQLFEKRRLLRTIIKQPDQMADRRFVLAAQSSLDPRQLATLLPAAITLAGSGRIVERVRNAMSGIDISPLSVSPEQLKPLPGYQYFEINVRHELWTDMLNKGETLNMHVDNRVPDLKVVMYAI